MIKPQERARQMVHRTAKFRCGAPLLLFFLLQGSTPRHLRRVSADAQHVKVATQPRLVIALHTHSCAGTKRARGTVTNQS
jgi:hypothetical protein